MGRIVRRFARFFEMEMRGNFEQGVPAARLTQYEADQVLHTIAINGTALGGTFGAVSFNAYANVTAAGILRTLHVRAHIADGVVFTGNSYGIHVEQEIVGTGQVAVWQGLRVEMYSPAGTTIADCAAIRIENYVMQQPTNHFFMWMAEDGGTTIRAAIYIAVGGAGDITNVFELAGAHTAWDPATAPAGAVVGRFAVLCGGVQLYVPLWT